MAHFEKTISEETIFTGRVFTVKKRQVEVENGNIHSREVVLHNGGAAVVPVDKDGNVYFVRQFRTAFECEVLEIPAGKLEKGENPFEAAKRELKEETGFSAADFINLGEMWPTVGYCGEKIYIYLATNLHKGETDPDEDEFLSLEKLPFDVALQKCMSGEIVDGKTLVGLLKAKEHLQTDGKKAFSGMADTYEKGRPEYPQALLDDLQTKYGLGKDSIVADIGSGTGIFTRQIADKVNFIYCVEPNADMREKAKNTLGKYKNIAVLPASAEDTELMDGSIDAVVAAQAFHWFDEKQFKAECRRIMKKGARAFLIWNKRDMEKPFTKECFDLYKKYSPRFKGFGGGIKEDDERIVDFFGGRYTKTKYENPLFMDREKFIKRSLSGSYSLKEGDAEYDEYMRRLNRLFDRYAKDGIIEMPNYTVMYSGEVKQARL